MKIAYITKTPWGENSPGFVFSYFQSKGFAENGLNTSLLMKVAKSESDDQKRIDKNLIKNHKVKLFKDNFGFIKSNEIFYKRVKKYIENNNFDILFSRDPGFLPYLSKLKKSLKIKTFYQSHNFYLDFNLHEYKNSLNRSKFHHNEKEFIKDLNCLFTLNDPQKKLYEKYVDTPIAACPPGLDLKKNLINNFKKRKVLYSGSFQKIKGIDDIIKIWNQGNFQNATLSLVGGRNKKELQYAKSLIKNTKNNLSVKSWLSYSALINYMKEISIGLIFLPDDFYNRYLTAPTKMFDFISCGIPVVCTELPSTKNLIPEGHQGVKLIKSKKRVEYINAIKELLEDEKKYDIAHKSNINLSKDITWKKMSKNFIKYF